MGSRLWQPQLLRRCSKGFFPLVPALVCGGATASVMGFIGCSGSELGEPLQSQEPNHGVGGAPVGGASDGPTGLAVGGGAGFDGSPTPTNPVAPMPSVPSSSAGGTGTGGGATPSSTAGEQGGGASGGGASGGTADSGSVPSAGGSGPEGSGGSAQPNPGSGSSDETTGADSQTDATSGTTTTEPDGDSEIPNQGSPGGADCGSLLLCDDFEGVSAGSSPSPATWSLVAGYTAVEQTNIVRVGTEQAHGGSQALRVDKDGLAGIFTAVAERKFFLRAFMRVDAAPLGPVLIGIGADTQPQSEVRFRVQQNSWATLNVVPGDAVLPQAAREGNCPTCPVVPVNQWFCVEFAVDADSREATLWFEGTEVATASEGVGGFPEMPNPIPVRLGTMSLQGGETGLWIDDVAISTTRIGCD